MSRRGTVGYRQNLDVSSSLSITHHPKMRAKLKLKQVSGTHFQVWTLIPLPAAGLLLNGRDFKLELEEYLRFWAFQVCCAYTSISHVDFTSFCLQLRFHSLKIEDPDVGWGALDSFILQFGFWVGAA
jgi:hypothetical protein